MKTNLFKLTSFLILGLMTSLVLYINYLSPVTGDTWGYLLKNIRSDYFSYPFEFYYKSYFVGNPRFGQLFLMICGKSAYHSALVTSLSSLVTFWVAASFSLQQKINFKSPFDVSILCLVSAMFFYFIPFIGKIFFYPPYNTNYVVGYALLLTLFWLVFSGLKKKEESGGEEDKQILLLTGLFFFSVVAGLTNEHTVPAFIAMGLVSIVFLKFYTQYSVKNSVISFIGVCLGYLMLFFAPGQSKRFKGIKYSAFDNPLESISKWCKFLRTYLFTEQTNLLLLLIFLGLILILVLSYKRKILFAKNSELKKMLLVFTFFISTSFLMLVVLFASPKLGPRLLYSSQVNLLVCVGLVWVHLFYMSCQKELLICLNLILSIYSVFYLKNTMREYQAYRAAFDSRAEKIIELKDQGVTNIVLPPLDYEFKSKHRIVWVEYQSNDPKWRINRLMAEYYKVDTFATDREGRPLKK